jgi:hypothetical protein
MTITSWGILSGTRFRYFKQAHRTVCRKVGVSNRSMGYEAIFLTGNAGAGRQAAKSWAYPYQKLMQSYCLFKGRYELSHVPLALMPLYQVVAMLRLKSASLSLSSLCHLH